MIHCDKACVSERPRLVCATEQEKSDDCGIINLRQEIRARTVEDEDSAHDMYSRP